MTGRFGPQGSRWWPQAALISLLVSTSHWPARRLATRTVALAASVTFAVAVAAAALTSRHLPFVGAIGVALGALLVSSIASAALIRFRQDQRPTPAEEQAAILRVQSIVSSLRERYGLEESEIDPPVKVIDTSGDVTESDLDRNLASAQSKSSDFFLSQVADTPRLTVILGELGAGKTSFLLRLTYQILRDRSQSNRELIPLFIKCRDWSDEYTTFDKWVTAAALKSYDVPTHVTDYWIRSGRVFVALDGLHELPPNSYVAFRNGINSWIRAAEGTRLAISSTMQPGIADLVRSLKIDQVCLIQPLPDLYIQRLMQRTFARLNFQDDVPTAGAMTVWVQELISQNRHLRGPALVGLLAEAIGESEQVHDDPEQAMNSKDPASVTFGVASSFFSRGDFAAAAEAFRVITRLSHSRWHVPAYALLGTCQYLLGDIDRASETMVEAVTLRLQETIRATPDVVQPLSDEEIQCLAAVPFDLSFDIVQISSAASLPLSQSREALRILRERGLVETVAGTRETARFRRSVTDTANW